MNNTYKVKIIKGCLLLFFCLSIIHVQAQEQGINIPDTAKIKEREQGYLLKIDKVYSTASISTASGYMLGKTPQVNLTNTLYGQIAGLSASQNSGEPGYNAASLHIRGTGTYDNSSLTIYVDGVQSTMEYLQFISTTEIESVSVLKDAAALAPFGIKGGNGVLWVITKRGQISKKTVITARISSGFDQPTILNKPLNSYDYANLYNVAISNDNSRVWNPLYTDHQLNAYKNGTATDVDWYHQALRSRTPLNTDAIISFKGGDSITKYNVMFNTTNSQGLANVSNNEHTSNQKLQLFNLRTNLDINIFKFAEAKIDLGGRIENIQGPNYSGAQLFNDLARYPNNIYPVKDVSGNWSGTSLNPNNPVATLNGLGWYKSHNRTLNANFNLIEHLNFLTQGLYIHQAVSINTYTQTARQVKSTYARYFNGGQTTADKSTDISATSQYPINQHDWKQYTVGAGYDRQFGKQQVTAAVDFLQSNYYAEGVQSLSNFKNLGGRFNYAFDNRYVAEFGFGYSGSDRYAPGHQWNFYPAISAAWIISNELFLKQSKIINYLKFRLSAGKVGNDGTYTGNYRYQSYYYGTNNFITGNSLATTSGYVQYYTPNPALSPEQSLKYNVGIDAELFNKLRFSLDAFVDKRSGIITQDNSYSAVFGINVPYTNVGSVTNRGFELTANFHDKLGGLNYSVTGIVGYAANIINYNAAIPTTYAYNGLIGRSIGTNLGLISDGFYQISDFNPDGSLKTGLPIPAFGIVQPGDLKYKDLNGDNRVDQNDITKIGKPSLPTLTYSANLGATFKNIDFQILIQGAGNRGVNLLNAYDQTVAFVGNGNAYEIAKGAWSYYPAQNIDTRATATYPRLTTLSNTNNYQSSTFWEKNADFVRIRSMELGYSLPKLWLSKSSIKSFRFYANATNPFTFSSLMKNYHLDPEVMSGYPAMKSYSIGAIAIF